MKISVVIPCYGSEKTIDKVVSELLDTMEKYQNYEIILVNDSSPDKIWQKILNICEKNQKIKAINLSKNFGQHSALMAGYSFATGDVIVSIDDDGQTSPKYIPILLDNLDEDTDVVYAKYDEKNPNLFRRFGTKLNFKMAEIYLGKPKNLYASSFFATKRFVIDEVLKYQGPYPYILGLVLRSTNKIKNVSVKHNERISGKSGYSLIKLIKLWMNGFTSFSVKPLRISSIIGSIIACVGFIYGIYIIIAKLILKSVTIEGYSSLMSIVLFSSGIIMILLGIIGEYVGRIYICLNKSPQFIIKEKINIKEDNNEKVIK